MKIERHLQSLKHRPKWRELRGIEIMATGMTVDEGSYETKLFDTTLQFQNGGLGILQRQTGKTTVTTGMEADLSGEKIVAGLGCLDRFLRIAQALNPRGGLGKNAYFNASSIHRLQALFIELGQPLFDGPQDLRGKEIG